MKACKNLPLIGVWLLLTAVLAIATAGVIKVSAQERRPQPQTKQYQVPSTDPRGDTAMPNIIVSPGEDYRIGPSDVIEIAIEDAPEMSRQFRVSGDGAIFLPFLGRLVVERKTPDELSAFIADKLRGEYLQNPQVSVAVLQINSRTYFVQGAVRHPGLYQIEGQPSLLKLITIAGGLNENYGSTAFIIRQLAAGPGAPAPNAAAALDTRTELSQPKEASPNAASTSSNAASASPADTAAKPQYELLKVNVNGLLRGNFDQDIVIMPGDIVHIPPTDVFFVAGEVNSPGSFPLKDGTTLRQAISLAQGVTFQSAAGRTIIFREDVGTGKRQEIAVDLPAVMNGKKSDVEVQANDIIIIPNSRLKSIGGTLLRAFGVNATRLPIR